MNYVYKLFKLLTMIIIIAFTKAISYGMPENLKNDKIDKDKIIDCIPPKIDLDKKINLIDGILDQANNHILNKIIKEKLDLIQDLECMKNIIKTGFSEQDISRLIFIEQLILNTIELLKYRIDLELDVHVLQKNLKEFETQKKNCTTEIDKIKAVLKKYFKFIVNFRESIKKIKLFYGLLDVTYKNNMIEKMHIPKEKEYDMDFIKNKLENIVNEDYIESKFAVQHLEYVKKRIIDPLLYETNLNYKYSDLSLTYLKFFQIYLKIAKIKKDVINLILNEVNSKKIKIESETRNKLIYLDEYIYKNFNELTNQVNEVIYSLENNLNGNILSIEESTKDNIKFFFNNYRNNKNIEEFKKYINEKYEHCLKNNDMNIKLYKYKFNDKSKTMTEKNNIKKNKNN